MTVTVGLLNSVSRQPLAMTHEAGEAAFRRGAAIAGWKQHNQDLFNKKLVEEKRLRVIQKYGREQKFIDGTQVFFASGDASIGEDLGDRRFAVFPPTND